MKTTITKKKKKLQLEWFFKIFNTIIHRVHNHLALTTSLWNKAFQNNCGDNRCRLEDDIVFVIISGYKNDSETDVYWTTSCSLICVFSDISWSKHVSVCHLRLGNLVDEFSLCRTLFLRVTRANRLQMWTHAHALTTFSLKPVFISGTLFPDQRNTYGPPVMSCGPVFALRCVSVESTACE